MEQSMLMNDGMFETNDEIMADRGIRVQDLFAPKNVRVNVPSSMRGKSQMSQENVIQDRRVASKRIHIERVIGLAKRYRILRNEMSHSKSAIGGKIINVCFCLCNYKPCIVNKDS